MNRATFRGVIAIDGPAASGKGTIAKRLAARFGLPHLDTGLLYRGVAVAAQDAGCALDEEESVARVAAALTPETLADPRLRTLDAGQAASIVASHPEVRRILLTLQREFAAQPGGAVLDGRDIGSVVCPRADAKIFVTADVETRARRRALELRERGQAADEAEILEALKERDRRDKQRDASPLVVPTDACLLDTTKLDIEQAVAAAVALVEPD